MARTNGKSGKWLVEVAKDYVMDIINKHNLDIRNKEKANVNCSKLPNICQEEKS